MIRIWAIPVVLNALRRISPSSSDLDTDSSISYDTKKEKRRELDRVFFYQFLKFLTIDFSFFFFFNLELEFPMSEREKFDGIVGVAVK